MQDQLKKFGLAPATAQVPKDARIQTFDTPPPRTREVMFVVCPECGDPRCPYGRWIRV